LKRENDDLGSDIENSCLQIMGGSIIDDRESGSGKDRRIHSPCEKESMAMSSLHPAFIEKFMLMAMSNMMRKVNHDFLV